jgi:hypothetical protein
VANAAQQITGFALAALKVKPKYMMRAAAQYASAPRTFAENVSALSPYMETRLSNEAEMMREAINDILINPSVYQNAKQWFSKHAYFLQLAVDSVMSPVVWTAAWNQAKENGATDLEARRLADSAVRETQGSTTPEDIAAFESGTPFWRMFTQFAGYFNMNANLLGTEFAKIPRDMGLRAGAGRGLYVLSLGFLAPAVVGEAIMQAFRGGPDDEDDDGWYLDDWMAALFGGSLRYATAMVPVVGQTVNAVVNMSNSKPYDDRISTAPAISMIEAAARAPSSVYKAIAEDGKPSKAIKDVATLISMSVGLPANALAKPAGYVADVMADRVEPTGPVDYGRGIITGVASPASKQ